MFTRMKELKAGAAVLAVMLALAAAPACKTLNTPPTEQTPATQQARLVEMNKLADLAEKTIDLARAAQDTEIQVYNAKLVATLDAAKHEQVQGAFKLFFSEAQKEMAVAKDVSTTDADRRKAVSRIADRVEELVNGLNIENPLVKATVGAILAAGRLLNQSVV